MTGKKKILAVDDNPTNLLLYEELLEDDYHLLTAEDGEQALVSVFEHEPDLILLDIMMPGLDGYEVSRRLRAAEHINEPKIILVSAKNSTTDRIEGYEAGADDYLIKPFDEDELKAKMGVYLELQSVQQIDQFKSDVIGLFNHETRTPLNGITGPLQLLRQCNETSTAEERIRWIDTMEHSARELSGFIVKALQLSELKSGQYPVASDTVDGNELMENVLSELETIGKDRRVELQTHVADAITFAGDKSLLQQSLVELGKNAIQHSEPDTRVNISIERQGEVVDIKVRNDGQTIDWKLLPHLFDGMMIQENDSGKTKKTLSLAIVKEISQLHEGMVTAHSSTDAGTEVSMQLPLAS